MMGVSCISEGSLLALGSTAIENTDAILSVLDLLSVPWPPALEGASCHAMWRPPGDQSRTSYCLAITVAPKDPALQFGFPGGDDSSPTQPAARVTASPLLTTPGQHEASAALSGSSLEWLIEGLSR